MPMAHKRLKSSRLLPADRKRTLSGSIRSYEAGEAQRDGRAAMKDAAQLQVRSGLPKGWQGGKPKRLPVRPVGRTAEGSNQRFEARHRLAGETGLPLITVRPGMNGETRYQPGMTYPHFPYRHFFAQLI